MLLAICVSAEAHHPMLGPPARLISGPSVAESRLTNYICIINRHSINNFTLVSFSQADSK